MHLLYFVEGALAFFRHAVGVVWKILTAATPLTQTPWWDETLVATLPDMLSPLLFPLQLSGLWVAHHTVCCSSQSSGHARCWEECHAYELQLLYWAALTSQPSLQPLAAHQTTDSFSLSLYVCPWHVCLYNNNRFKKITAINFEGLWLITDKKYSRHLSH